MRINNKADERLLERRSRLEFHYPGDEGILILMPFYENPDISESQAANYVEYNPIARAGSLYAYTGAKSRKIKLKLKYTIPHLANFEMGIDRFQRIFKGASKASKKALFLQRSHHDIYNSGDAMTHSLAAEVEKHYWALRSEEGINWNDVQKIPELNSGNLPQRRPAMHGFRPAFAPGNISIDAPDTKASMGSTLTTEQVIGALDNTEKWKVLDTLLFFMALVRTSVTNNVSDPLHGPPLIRLMFGTMYQSVPCICKNYSIDWEEEAGYDLTTLTPRRLNINLTLDEVRIGDWGTYNPARYASRDNLTGWESAINSPFTTDPLSFTGD